MLNSSPTQPVRPVQPGQPVRTDPQSEAYRANLRAQQRRTLYTFSQLVWLAFGVLEGLIGLRIVLRLMAANPANPFAHLIYAVTYPFLWPFLGLTVTPRADGVVLELSSIIALVVYALLSVLVQRLLWILFDRQTV